MNIAFTKSRIKAIISEEHDIMIREKETGPVSKGVHTVLDFIGLIPGWGEWADVLNAAIHAKEGNYLLASLSAISVIPVVGDAIGKGGKVTLKLRRLFPKAMKQVEKYAPEVVKGVRGLRATIQRNKGKIDKLLDLLEEEGHLSEYIDEIRMAINVLASSEETDESIAEKISGEMFKPDAAIWDDARLKTPDEEEIKASKGIRVAVSKKKDEEDEASGASGISGAGGGSGGSGGWGMFDSTGRIKPEFLKFEGSKIDDMIREEMNKLVIEMIEKNKKNLEKKKMREEQLEEIVRMVLKETSMKKSYKRDEKGDEEEPWWYKENLIEEDDVAAEEGEEGEEEEGEDAAMAKGDAKQPDVRKSNTTPITGISEEKKITRETLRDMLQEEFENIMSEEEENPIDAARQTISNWALEAELDSISAFLTQVNQDLTAGQLATLIQQYYSS